MRAAVIGLGVGQKHAEVYAGRLDCELVAVCDFDSKKLAAAQAAHPAARCTVNADDVLSDPAIDVISIASYDNFHCNQIVAALSNGKHVFVEKPLCLSERELEAIAAAVRARPDLKLSSNLVLRSVPRFAEVRRLIANGTLGRLFYAEGDYLYGRLHKITKGWRGSLDFYSVVYGGAVHLVDLLLWLTGDEVTEVSAFGNRIASDKSGFEFNDMVAALLHFKSGMISKVSANFGCVHPHFHNLAVYGTQGTFVNGLGEGALFKSRVLGEGPSPMLEAYPGRNQAALLNGFLDALLGNDAEVYARADEVFRGMAVCLAIEQAVEQRATVKVRYIET